MNSQVRTSFLRGSLTTGLLALLSVTAQAAPRHPEQSVWVPDTLFVQAGEADKATTAYSVGAGWNWDWSRRYRLGLLTGYTEATVGRWRTDTNSAAGEYWFTQVGVTPVLRLFPGSESLWFGEIGIGANYISPLYRTDGKRFSTEFNFGDHAAIGRILGDHRQGSVALRLQHFSNGGIDAPNPGENFLQLRYSYQFRAR
jgi:lipid A 3-O-deacylase